MILITSPICFVPALHTFFFKEMGNVRIPFHLFCNSFGDNQGSKTLMKRSRNTKSQSKGGKSQLGTNEAEKFICTTCKKPFVSKPFSLQDFHLPDIGVHDS